MIHTSDLNSIMGKYVQLGPDCDIIGPASLCEGKEGYISFCDPPYVNKPSRRPLDLLDGETRPLTYEETKLVIQKVKKSESSVIVCPLSEGYDTVEGKTLLLVDNPRLVFMSILNKFYVPVILNRVDNSALLSLNCKIGENVSIYGNVYIYQNVIIGNNVEIYSGSVIGAEGFGWRRKVSGDLVNFPQIGGVIIEDDVTIKSNVCIDRGTLGNTVIGKGTKIDNKVHIAHNVKIGKNCVIVANCMIAGSVEIGNNCWIAPSVSILNQVKIGDNCVVGMGSVVLKDVESGHTVKGVPAHG